MSQILDKIPEKQPAYLGIECIDCQVKCARGSVISVSHYLPESCCLSPCDPGHGTYRLLARQKPLNH